jgi:DNA-binding CsgD family transcriptional regulator
MLRTLHSLINAISLAPSELELRLRFMDTVGELFQAHHWSISLLNKSSELASIDIKGLPDSFIDYYINYGVTIDPLRAYVLNHHAPIHEQVLFTEESWKRSTVYINGCGLQYDHEHVMTGPIVGSGKLVGLVNFARTSATPAFNSQDIAMLGTLCMHISATLGMLELQPQPYLPLSTQLTPRELQIARLVAQGLTNTEIGADLWITQNSVKQALKRMFRKLNVSARTELVAKIFAKYPC